MPFFLSERETDCTEWMDDPACPLDKLENTYAQFAILNPLISGWRSIYKNHIRPFAQSNTGPTSMLDIGFGGGDIPLKLENWARRDAIDLSITAIENDPRALDYVKKQQISRSIRFLLATPDALFQNGESFHFVISNHLLHHLSQSELQKMLELAQGLSRYKVLFNDIERGDLGYLLFKLLSRPVFRSSFITHDGLISIRRSYTRDELQRTVPKGWRVTRFFPYRLLLEYDHGPNS